MREFKLVVVRKYEFENRNLKLLRAFLAYSICQDSDAKKKVVDFLFESSSSSKKLSTETLMKELNYVVLERSEFEHPIKSLFIDVFGMQRSWNEVFRQKVFRTYFVISGSWETRMARRGRYQKHKKVQFFLFINFIRMILKFLLFRKKWLLSKLHPTCPREHFDRKLFEIFQFFKHCYGFWVKVFRLGCQKCILRVRRNNLAIFFPKIS